jgi:arylsulfatase A-like enzyme
LSSRTGSIVRLSIAIGFIYGFVEAAEVMVLYNVPGALSWLTGNTPEVLWLAPVFYAVAFGIVGVAFATLARVFPRIDWQAGLVFVLLALGGFLAASTQGRLASDLTALIFGIGVGAEGTRRIIARRETLVPQLVRAVPLLAVVVAAAALGTIAFARMREVRALAGLPAARTDAPNVVLLVIDTQRADHLSLYGYGRPTSPRIDRLAQESAVFSNASANSTWTLPSHATMFTGRLPFEHRAGNLGYSRLDGRFPTIAEALAARGYATGGFIANVFWTGRHTGLDRGFTRYEDFYGTFGDALTRTTLGRRVAYDVLPMFGFVDVPGRKHASDLNKSVLSWIDRSRGHPFFAFVNYFDVHAPWIPPAPYAGSYSGMTPAELRSHSVAIKDLDGTDPPPPASELRRMVDTYDESIHYLDSQIGALVDSLEARGILDKTVFIVTSDHGESWGEHGLMFHGHSLYRDVTHIPLIIRTPSGTAARYDHPVGLDDIPETIGAFAGLERGSFPGHSVFDDSASADSGVVLQLARRTSHVGRQPASKSSLSGLVTGHWQYVEPHSGNAELFDLRSDPNGLRDVAQAEDSVVRGLHTSLAKVDRGRPSRR